MKKRKLNNKGITAVQASFLAILFGLGMGFVILLLGSPENSIEGFLITIKGGLFSGAYSGSHVISLATPIIMTGLAVAVAYKAGLFNIGASGQLIVGGFAAVCVGAYGECLGPFQWVVALLAAGICGGFWGWIVGVLRAYRHVNEVISSIMLNYIGMYLVNMLVKFFVYDQSSNRSVQLSDNALLPSSLLTKIFPDSMIDIGFTIAILCVIAIWFVLKRSKTGFEIVAAGYNSEACRYAGMNGKRVITFTMTLSGILAGIGGALMFLGNAGEHIMVTDTILVQGFDGISVALLANSNPVGVLFSGLFIANISAGGEQLQTLNYSPEVVQIILSVIVYCSAMAVIFKEWLGRRRKHIRLGEPTQGEEATQAERVTQGEEATQTEEATQVEKQAKGGIRA